MATQPVIETQPSIPPAQTNCMVLHQTGICKPVTVGTPAGDVPDMQVEMARAQLIDYFRLSSDMTVGTQLLSRPDVQYPHLPEREDVTGYFSPSYSCQVYFNQHVYWNADVILHFWAVKPPSSVGRVRITYTPPGPVPVSDPANREITASWDLSASNLFEFKIPSYNPRSWKNTHANYAPLNGLARRWGTPQSDIKAGYIRMYVTHQYQPGSIFPQECTIYCFQSFQNPQFSTVLGPALHVNRSALTQILQVT